jgi:nucleotide-binding universal stress UspA family protein
MPATDAGTLAMYSHILLPVDLSDEHSWQKALPTAIALCDTFQATLHVMTVVPEFGLPMVGQFFPADYEAKLHEHAAKQLEDFVAAQIPNRPNVQLIVAAGKIYQQIQHTAERVKADLIIMGSHRPELSDYLLGPNAARVVRHAPCSVMVVRT